jgi:enterochelin esterase family protein
MLLKNARITELANKLSQGNTKALEEFWRDVKSMGTPLLEPILEQDNLAVTFVLRTTQQGNHSLLLGTPANLDALNHNFINLPNTDLWYLTLALPPDLRTVYGLLLDAPLLPEDFIDAPDFALLGQFFTALQNNLKPDDFNNKSYEIPPGIWLNPKKIPLSLLELPAAPTQPWVPTHDDVKKGTLTQFRFKSKILGNERTVWLYMPPPMPKEDEKKRALLILFDGDAYTSVVPTPTILDNLIDAKKIPPCIAIFFDNPDDPTRDYELGCNPLMPRFIQEELLPVILDSHNITYDPTNLVIAGSSFGGLGALYAGFLMPACFSKIISLSGHLGFGGELQRKDEWLINEFATNEPLPLEIYLSVGSLESGPPTFDKKPSFIDANSAMRDVLELKGYRFCYNEYAGGHDYVNWQHELAQGLIFLFSRHT